MKIVINPTILKNSLITVSAVVLAILRIAGFKNPTFQAIAHIFIGGLIAVYLYNRKEVFIFIVALVLSAIEFWAFIMPFIGSE